MAAKQSQLSALHEALAEMFLDDIKACKDAGIPMAASDKAVIVKFLKDNSITADLGEDDMQRLKDEFKDELAARRKAKAQSILSQSEEEEELASFL